MKKIGFIFLFQVLVILLYGQNSMGMIDSVILEDKMPINSINGKFNFYDTKILTSSDWKTNLFYWFGDNKVTLKPLKKLPDIDTSGLNKEEYTKICTEWRYLNYGERIHFDKQGGLNYSYSMSCSVGETLYDIKKIEIKNNCIVVEHAKYRWNEEKKYKVSYYLIEKWTSDEILLTLLD